MDQSNLESNQPPKNLKNPLTKKEVHLLCDFMKKFNIDDPDEKIQEFNDEIKTSAKYEVPEEKRCHAMTKKGVQCNRYKFKEFDHCTTHLKTKTEAIVTEEKDLDIVKPTEKLVENVEIQTKKRKI